MKAPLLYAIASVVAANVCRGSFDLSSDTRCGVCTQVLDDIPKLYDENSIKRYCTSKFNGCVGELDGASDFCEKFVSGSMNELKKRDSQTTIGFCKSSGCCDVSVASPHESAMHGTMSLIQQTREDRSLDTEDLLTRYMVDKPIDPSKVLTCSNQRAGAEVCQSCVHIMKNAMLRAGPKGSSFAGHQCGAVCNTKPLPLRKGGEASGEFFYSTLSARQGQRQDEATKQCHKLTAELAEANLLGSNAGFYRASFQRSSPVFDYAEMLSTFGLGDEFCMSSKDRAALVPAIMACRAVSCCQDETFNEAFDATCGEKRIEDLSRRLKDVESTLLPSTDVELHPEDRAKADKIVADMGGKPKTEEEVAAEVQVILNTPGLSKIEKAALIANKRMSLDGAKGVIATVDAYLRMGRALKNSFSVASLLSVAKDAASKARGEIKRIAGETRVKRSKALWSIHDYLIKDYCKAATYLEETRALATLSERAILQWKLDQENKCRPSVVINRTPKSLRDKKTDFWTIMRTNVRETTPATPNAEASEDGVVSAHDARKPPTPASSLVLVDNPSLVGDICERTFGPASPVVLFLASVMEGKDLARLLGRVGVASLDDKALKGTIFAPGGQFKNLKEVTAYLSADLPAALNQTSTNIEPETTVEKARRQAVSLALHEACVRAYDSNTIATLFSLTARKTFNSSTPTPKQMNDGEVLNKVVPSIAEGICNAMDHHLGFKEKKLDKAETFAIAAVLENVINAAKDAVTAIMDMYNGQITGENIQDNIGIRIESEAAATAAALGRLLAEVPLSGIEKARLTDLCVEGMRIELALETTNCLNTLQTASERKTKGVIAAALAEYTTEENARRLIADRLAEVYAALTREGVEPFSVIQHLSCTASKKAKLTVGKVIKQLSALSTSRDEIEAALLPREARVIGEECSTAANSTKPVCVPSGGLSGMVDNELVDRQVGLMDDYQKFIAAYDEKHGAEGVAASQKKDFDDRMDKKREKAAKNNGDASAVTHTEFDGSDKSLYDYENNNVGAFDEAAGTPWDRLLDVSKELSVQLSGVEKDLLVNMTSAAVVLTREDFETRPTWSVGIVFLLCVAACIASLIVARAMTPVPWMELRELPKTSRKMGENAGYGKVIHYEYDLDQLDAAHEDSTSNIKSLTAQVLEEFLPSDRELVLGTLSASVADLYDEVELNRPTVAPAEEMILVDPLGVPETNIFSPALVPRRDAFTRHVMITTMDDSLLSEGDVVSVTRYEVIKPPTEAMMRGEMPGQARQPPSFKERLWQEWGSSGVGQAWNSAVGYVYAGGKPKSE